MSLRLQFLALQARLARIFLRPCDRQSVDSLQYKPNTTNRATHRNPSVNVQRASFSLRDLLEKNYTLKVFYECLLAL